MRHRRGKDAEAERMRVHLENVEFCGERDDGQFEFTAIAQFFNVVNDRMMIFRKGSFSKTIKEKITNGSGRVKINDSHHHSSRDTLGTVVEAEERDVGVWYRGVLSSTEDALYTKMVEGHVDENSIEFNAIEEGVTRVPLEDVPEGAFIWDQSTGDGTVEVRELLVVSWQGLGILPWSSQGLRAILEINAAVPFQDLPVASAASSWDPDGAQQRLREWAGVVERAGKPSMPNASRLACAFMVRGPVKEGAPELIGQIADVVDGRLVVVPDALDAALEELAGNAHLAAPDLAAIMTTASRYRKKVRSGLASDATDVVTSPTADDPAGPAPPGTPPTDDARSDDAPDAVAQELAGWDLQLRELELEALATEFQEFENALQPGRGRESSPGGLAEVQ